MTDSEKQRALELARRIVDWKYGEPLVPLPAQTIDTLSRALLAATAEVARLRAVMEAAERLNDAWYSEVLNDATGERDAVLVELEQDLSASVDDYRAAKKEQP